MTLTVYEAKSPQENHYVGRGSSHNLFGDYIELYWGDGSKTPVGSDTRRSVVMSFDIGNPDTGTVITKGATIDDVRFEFVPSQTRSAVLAPNNSWRMALIASDGYWDRSTSHHLYALNGSGIHIGPSDIGRTIDLRVKNSASTEIADAMTDDTGWASFSTGGFVPATATIGSTIEIPADEDIKTVSLTLNRFDVTPPIPDTTLIAVVYELWRNGRNYAVDHVIGTSDPINYSDLVQNLVATNTVDFTFDTPIPASTETRWVGVILEGTRLDAEALSSVQRLVYKGRDNTASPIGYLSGTAGSLIFATKQAIYLTWQNSFYESAYLARDSVPFIYPANSTTKITTPYQRYFGNVMGKDITNIVLNVTESIGSTGSGAENIVSGMEDEVQAWFDSEWYDPDIGRTWIGLLLEIFNPNNLYWLIHGPANVVGANKMKIYINWTEPTADEVCDFGVEAMLAVSSGSLETLRAVGSFPISAETAVSHEGVDVDAAVGAFGLGSSSVVVSSLELISVDRDKETVVDFGLEIDRVVAGGLISAHLTVESFPVGVERTVASFGSEIEPTVGHYGVGVSSAVASFSLSVGEC